jgi:hypothetical protein
MILAAQIGLIAIVAFFILSPIVLRRGERAWVESRDEALLRGVQERKARLYTGIVELDFDRDSGKISQEDHARMRADAMKEVLTVLQEEESLAKGGRHRPTVIQGGDAAERMIEEYKRLRLRDAEGGRK